MYIGSVIKLSVSTEGKNKRRVSWAGGVHGANWRNGILEAGVETDKWRQEEKGMHQTAVENGKLRTAETIRTSRYCQREDVTNQLYHNKKLERIT
jgi:hypothetical protein